MSPRDGWDTNTTQSKGDSDWANHAPPMPQADSGLRRHVEALLVFVEQCARDGDYEAANAAIEAREALATVDTTLDVERLDEAFETVVTTTPGVWVDYSGTSNQGSIPDSRRAFIQAIAAEYATLPDKEAEDG